MIVALILLIGVLVAWLIASIPVWVGAKVVGGDASIGKAMIATLAATIVFSILLVIFGVFSRTVGFIAGFIGILAVFKAIFNVGWGGAFLTAIIAFIVFIIMIIVLAAIGLSLPMIIHASMFIHHY
jgi:hypothetical protein